MVLDAQVEQAPAPGRLAAIGADDEQRRRLLAADIAALAFGCLQRDHEPLGEIAIRGFVGRNHRCADRRLPHQVGLHGERLAGRLAVLVDRHVARVVRNIARRIDHADLAHVGVFIDCQQRGKCLLRRFAGTHELETQRPVVRINKGLRRDGAHAGLGPRDQRADREPVRLDGDTQLPRSRIAGNDRVRADRPQRPIVGGQRRHDKQ